MSRMPPDMRKLMQEAARLQTEMAQRREELEGRTFEGSAGGGVVKVIVRGSGMVEAVIIDPSVLDPEDPELVGDLVVAAANQALAAVQEATAATLGGLGGGLDLGGLGDLGGLLG